VDLEMLGVDQRVLKIVWTVFLFALAVALVYPYAAL
jgi:hypothetical protein